MNRRHLLPTGSALIAAGLFVAACSSTASSPAASAGASLTLPSIAIPSVAIPSLAIPSNLLPSSLPSIAIPSSVPSIAIPSSLPSIAIPSIAIPSSIPSFAIPSIALPSGSIDISCPFGNEDPDLENRLPTSVNGVTLTRCSVKGSSFIESGSSDQQDLIDLLSALGKTPDDMSVAFAGDAAGNLDLQIGAFRVNGADSNALLTGFVNATKKESPEDTITTGSVGGKNVTQIVDPTDTESGSIYLYANGDTLFYVTSPDATLAAAALQEMP